MSSPRKAVYDPRTFFLHAALLGQACAPCGALLPRLEEAYAVLSTISRRYSSPGGRFPRVTHPSATPSLRRERAFDLHVLGTPPAFILSQDQTRHPVI